MESFMKSTTRRIVDLLWCPDETNTSIARKTGKHRDSIRKYRANMQVSGLNKKELDALDDAQLDLLIKGPKRVRSRFYEPDLDQVLINRKKPGVTLRILHGQYVDEVNNFNDPNLAPMSESLFYQRVREHKKKRGPEFRHEHVPGGSLQFDFSGKRPTYIDNGGKVISAELAIAVLPFSGLTFAMAIASQSLPHCTEAFVSALEYFGGVPDDAVFDNFKAAVDKPRRGSEPAKINLNFQACLDHYSLFPDPTRTYAARDKGMVEKMVQEVQRSFLGKGRYLNCYSLSDLNETLKEALDEINHRPMSKRAGMSRWQIFKSQEAACLAPLPTARYEFGRWQVGLTVPLHYHVFVDGVGYSVPSRFVGAQVNVKATANSVEIFTNGFPIAIHQRSNDLSGRKTSSDHLPAHHKAMTSYRKEAVLRFSESLGPIVATFVQEHLNLHRNVKAAGDMVKKLSSKIHHYGRLAVENAITEALERGQINALAVYGILERGRTCFQEDLPSPSKPSGNIRGAEYYSDEGDN